MPTVTLLAKARSNSQLKLVDSFLKSIFEGLKVKTGPCVATSRGWVQATISGEDETIALNYLASEIGLCPTELESISQFSTMKGQIAALDKNKAEVTVDIGVFSPEFVDATIPLQSLQTQLVDGRKVALPKFIELFGWLKNSPLTVKVVGVNEEKKRIEATLAEKQLRQYGDWTRSLLDRLIVLSTPIHDVESALQRTGCERDVVNIERLGLFEHAIVCKLGTDAVGLIPKIGRILPKAAFSIFNPKKIIQFLGEDSPLLTS